MTHGISKKYIRALSLLLIVSLLWSTGGPVLAQDLPQEYTFEECDRLDEALLRDELNLIAQEALDTNTIDIERIVREQWTLLGMDAIVDAEVEKAVAQVHEQEDYLSRLWSAWSPDKAKDLASEVANIAFGSEPFKEAVGALSTGVAGEITQELEMASARSASSALMCMQEFIGERYSENMVTIFQEEISSQVEDVEFSQVDAGGVSILTEHSTALAGLGVIIGTQIAKRLAQKLAQRLAGRITGRVLGRAAASFVPIAGWIIGAGLIVWDLVEGGKGALPQIEEALKGDEVKEEIRAETVAAIGPELEAELPLMARTIANDIYSTWLDFKRQYDDVLALAEENATFRQLLEDASTEEVYRLSKQVAVGLNALGTDALVNAIEDGTFERVYYLPESALQIVETTDSLQTTIAWGELAGSMLDDVVRLEIYKVKEPEDFTRDSLASLIAIDDAATVTKLLLLDTQSTETMMALPIERLQRLAVTFDVEDLTWLAAYLQAMESREARNQLVTRLLDSPSIIEELKNEKVKEAVVESENVSDTIDFLASPRSLQSFIVDSMTLAYGNISWWQHYQKYTPVWIGVFILLGLLVLRFVFWYLRPFVSPRA